MLEMTSIMPTIALIGRQLDGRCHSVGRCPRNNPAPKGVVYAFTLIELLVVVSVIAILTGFLLPTVGMVKESARGNACRGLLRQFGLANAVYAENHDGMYVAIVQTDGGGSPWMKWYSNKDYLDCLDKSPAGTTLYANKGTIDKALWCPNVRDCLVFMKLIRAESIRPLIC